MSKAQDCNENLFTVFSLSKHLCISCGFTARFYKYSRSKNSTNLSTFALTCSICFTNVLTEELRENTSKNKTVQRWALHVSFNSLSFLFIIHAIHDLNKLVQPVQEYQQVYFKLLEQAVSWLLFQVCHKLSESLIQTCWKQPCNKLVAPYL